MLRTGTLGLLAALGTCTLALSNTPDLPAICEQAAQTVSRESGVPLSVLMAISLNETGKKTNGTFRPWPWTVNMEGKGHWFDTLDEARAFVFKNYKRGARSFDIGCFQVNYKWHGQAFRSIDEMFDPMANARYAARFLSALHEEKGNWEAAAGAYHSRTRKYADRYAARFKTFRAKYHADKNTTSRPVDMVQYLASRQPPDKSEIPEIPDIILAQRQNRREVRQNNYPLLIPREGATAKLGRASGASLFASALKKRGEPE